MDLLKKRIGQALALFSVAPFLMGFEPRRDEGLTVGVGGSAGRGHYSTGCGQRSYYEEFAAGSLSLDYTYPHDSARVYSPRVTIGGALAAGVTETKLIAEDDMNPEWLVANPQIDIRRAALAGFLLRLDWTYLGLGAGGVLAVPEWHQGELDANALPAAEVRVGPWKHVYATASMGGGFAMPVPVPFEFAAGLGWQGSHFGAWLGRAVSGYDAPENLLTLSYRFRRVTVLGSVGLYADVDESYPRDDKPGDNSRAALGLRFNL